MNVVNFGPFRELNRFGPFIVAAQECNVVLLKNDTLELVSSVCPFSNEEYVSTLHCEFTSTTKYVVCSSECNVALIEVSPDNMLVVTDRIVNEPGLVLSSLVVSASNCSTPSVSVFAFRAHVGVVKYTIDDEMKHTIDTRESAPLGSRAYEVFPVTERLVYSARLFAGPQGNSFSCERSVLACVSSMDGQLSIYRVSTGIELVKSLSLAGPLIQMKSAVSTEHEAGTEYEAGTEATDSTQAKTSTEATTGLNDSRCDSMLILGVSADSRDAYAWTIGSDYQVSKTLRLNPSSAEKLWDIELCDSLERDSSDPIFAVLSGENTLTLFDGAGGELAVCKPFNGRVRSTVAQYVSSPRGSSRRQLSTSKLLCAVGSRLEAVSLDSLLLRETPLTAEYLSQIRCLQFVDDSRIVAVSGDGQQSAYKVDSNAMNLERQSRISRTDLTNRVSAACAFGARDSRPYGEYLSLCGAVDGSVHVHGSDSCQDSKLDLGLGSAHERVTAIIAFPDGAGFVSSFSGGTISVCLRDTSPPACGSGWRTVFVGKPFGVISRLVLGADYCSACGLVAVTDSRGYLTVWNFNSGRPCTIGTAGQPITMRLLHAEKLFCVKIASCSKCGKDSTSRDILASHSLLCSGESNEIFHVAVDLKPDPLGYSYTSIELKSSSVVKHVNSIDRILTNRVVQGSEAAKLVAGFRSTELRLVDVELGVVLWNCDLGGSRRCWDMKLTSDQRMLRVCWHKSNTVNSVAWNVPHYLRNEGDVQTASTTGPLSDFATSIVKASVYDNILYVCYKDGTIRRFAQGSESRLNFRCIDCIQPSIHSVRSLIVWDAGSHGPSAMSTEPGAKSTVSSQSLGSSHILCAGYAKSGVSLYSYETRSSKSVSLISKKDRHVRVNAISRVKLDAMECLLIGTSSGTIVKHDLHHPAGDTQEVYSVKSGSIFCGSSSITYDDSLSVFGTSSGSLVILDPINNDKFVCSEMQISTSCVLVISHATETASTRTKSSLVLCGAEDQIFRLVDLKAQCVLSSTMTVGSTILSLFANTCLLQDGRVLEVVQPASPLQKNSSNQLAVIPAIRCPLVDPVEVALMNNGNARGGTILIALGSGIQVISLLADTSYSIS